MATIRLVPPSEVSDELQQVLKNHVKADELDDKEFLMWEEIILCRAEVNQNNDGLTTDNLHELEATLRLNPVTDEHHNRPVGVFLDATVDNMALSTSGFVWRQRFPEVADDIRSGRRSLSLEAWSEEVICGACGGQYRSERQYCAHLSNREAVRWHRRMHAVGGGIVENPAGTGTDFNQELLYVASVGGPPGQKPSEEPKMADDKKQPQENMVTADDHSKVVTERDNFKTRLDSAMAEISELKAGVDDLKTQHRAELERQKTIAHRMTRLAPHLSVEELEEVESELGEWSDKSFNLFAARVERPKETEDGTGAEDEDVPRVQAKQVDARDKDKALTPVDEYDFSSLFPRTQAA